MQKEDTQVYEVAAENTASGLAESWMSWVNGQQVLPPSSAMQPPSDISSTQTWKLSEQQKELAPAGLDSSVLSPFSENISEFNEHDNEFVPPTSIITKHFLQHWQLIHQSMPMLIQTPSKNSSCGSIPLHSFFLALHWLRSKAFSITSTQRMPYLSTSILTAKVPKSFLL